MERTRIELLVLAAIKKSLSKSRKGMLVALDEFDHMTDQGGIDTDQWQCGVCIGGECYWADRIEITEEDFLDFYISSAVYPKMMLTDPLSGKEEEMDYDFKDDIMNDGHELGRDFCIPISYHISKLTD